MERVAYGIVALMGVAAVLVNRRFGEVVSMSMLGRDTPRSSRRYRVVVGYSRTIIVATGTVMAICGLLGALGIRSRG